MKGQVESVQEVNDARRQAQLSEFVMSQVEELASPPSQWEDETLATVLLLPRVHVTRLKEEKLLAEGMVRIACHSNCAWLESRYPREVQHVSGWLIDRYMLVLHSVIRTHDRWICVTPQTAPSSPSSFNFIPDQSIKWGPEDEEMVPRIADVRVPGALRKYPADSDEGQIP